MSATRGLCLRCERHFEARMTPNEWERELSERLARLTPSRGAEDRVVASVRRIVDGSASNARALRISSRQRLVALVGMVLALLLVASLRPKRPQR